MFGYPDLDLAFNYSNDSWILWLVFGIVWAVLWVFYALGFSEVIKRKTPDKSWMAWVPFASSVALSKLTPSLKFNGKQVNPLQYVFLVFASMCVLLSLFLFVGGLWGPWLCLVIALSSAALHAPFHMQLIAEYRPQDATVLGIFFPIGYFIIRNQVMGRLPQQAYGQQPYAGQPQPYPGQPYAAQPQPPYSGQQPYQQPYATPQPYPAPQQPYPEQPGYGQGYPPQGGGQQ